MTKTKKAEADNALKQLAEEERFEELAVDARTSTAPSGGPPATPEESQAEIERLAVRHYALFDVLPSAPAPLFAPNDVDATGNAETQAQRLNMRIGHMVHLDGTSEQTGTLTGFVPDQSTPVSTHDYVVGLLTAAKSALAETGHFEHNRAVASIDDAIGWCVRCEETDEP